MNDKKELRRGLRIGLMLASIAANFGWWFGLDARIVPSLLVIVVLIMLFVERDNETH